MKPVYVFDGKPPQLKRDELDRRYAPLALSTFFHSQRPDATVAMQPSLA